MHVIRSYCLKKFLIISITQKKTKQYETVVWHTYIYIYVTCCFAKKETKTSETSIRWITSCSRIPLSKQPTWPFQVSSVKVTDKRWTTVDCKVGDAVGCTCFSWWILDQQKLPRWTMKRWREFPKMERQFSGNNMHGHLRFSAMCQFAGGCIMDICVYICAVCVCVRMRAGVCFYTYMYIHYTYIIYIIYVFSPFFFFISGIPR